VVPGGVDLEEEDIGARLTTFHRISSEQGKRTAGYDSGLPFKWILHCMGAPGVDCRMASSSSLVGDRSTSESNLAGQ
jgi:hypothetical protein